MSATPIPLDPRPKTIVLDHAANPRLCCPICGASYSDGRGHCALDGAKLAEDLEALIGTTIDQYKILEILGQGGMGSVYRARHELLQQNYAIKILSGELSSRATMAQRFLREARAAATIDHPNVVRVLYSNTTPGGLPFLVMELLEGRSLHQLLQDQPPEPRRAAFLVRQIVSGLAAIHREGFLHRDIKPSNIMVEGSPGDERIKILDLGLVGFVDEGSEPKLTREGQVMGTAPYLAPEIIRGEPPSEQTDLYAVGVVLYELLTGRVPFDGTTQQVLWHQVVSPPPHMSTSTGLEDLVADLLQKDPAGRPRSAEEVLRRIDDWLAGASEATVHVARPGRAPAKKRGVLWVAAAIGALVLVLGVFGFALHRSTRVESLPLSTPSLAPSPSPSPEAEAAKPAPDPVLETAPIAEPPAAEPAAPAERAAPPRVSKKKLAKKPAAKLPGVPIEVTLTSDPPGAEVSMNGGVLGKTPLTVSLQENLRVKLRFSAPNFTARSIQLRPSAKKPETHVRLEPAR